MGLLDLISQKFRPGHGLLNYGARADGTAKGGGYFGNLRTAGGDTMTEYSVNVDGREMPSVVPTLTRQELYGLLHSGQISEEVLRKAIEHADLRESQGFSPFAGPQDRQPRPRYR